jgi:ABC-type Fe2+-enterobactin transport system substrate-binding protein
MHANINSAVAQALGQRYGETWHDLGEKVASLRAENEQMKEDIQLLSAPHESVGHIMAAKDAEIERLKDLMGKLLIRLDYEMDGHPRDIEATKTIMCHARAALAKVEKEGR